MFNHNYNVNYMYHLIKNNNYGFTAEDAMWWEKEIIHPYVGFVYDFNDAKTNLETRGFPRPLPR